MTMRPNALHLTRPSRHCCNRGVSWAGSLSYIGSLPASHVSHERTVFFD